jgi:hypothetical protein
MKKPVSANKFLVGLKRLLSVSKEELSARLRMDREQRRANRKDT